jgi:hypothetical protein
MRNRCPVCQKATDQIIRYRLDERMCIPCVVRRELHSVAGWDVKSAITLVARFPELKGSSC